MIKTSELIARIWKPDAVQARDHLDDLGRELDRLHGEVDSLYRAFRSGMLTGVPKTWTPTLWQNGAQISITIDYADYAVVGEVISVWTRFSTTAAGAVGLVEVRGLPIPSRQRFIGGSFLCFTGGINYDGSTVGDVAGTRLLGAMDGSTANFGVSPAVALASGATLRVNANYLGVRQ